METGYQATLRLDDDDFDCAQKRTKVRASLALFKNLAHMLQQQQFCDLVFELTGSIKFHTHRLVFALWSPVMMNLLNQSSSRMEKVLVKTNLQGAFKQFVHFLYTGTFEGNITDIDGVLLLASTFQIPLLRSLCEKQLQQAVSVENVIGLFRTSVKYQLSFLEKQCVEHIQDHLPEVAQQSELKDLNPEQFNTFLASKHVSQLNPEMKLFLIISWLTEHVNDRQHFLVLLLRHIDWSTVAQDFLTEISQTENFFTSHPSSLYLLLQTLHSASISLGPYTDRFVELRREYNEILNNVVTNSVNIGNGRQEVFQPIQLTLISSLAREKEKTQSESKKTNIVSSNRNSSNCKTSKVKLKPDPPRDSGSKAVNKNVSSNNTGVGSRKRGNSVLGNKNLKEKEGAGKLKKSNTSSAKQNGNRQVTSTPRAASEGGSMRRKTLRPRKVVSSSSSISIVSPASSRTVSTRRSTALQKAERDNNEEETDTSLLKSAQSNPETNQHQDDEETDEEEGHDDYLLIKTEEYVGDNDDNDDDYVDPSALKRRKKERSKTVLGKSKMGRPRKGHERNKFSCPQCEYVTRKSYLLDKHIRQVHESKRVIKCPICEFRCNWSKKLYLHMRTDHYNNSGPPFVCDIQECTYTNDKMNKMVEHRRSHTGDRPFMCDECKMSFRSKSNLYAHFKCHNDIRNHECPICHQRFKMKITMEQHMVVHDDARPYECNLCGFSTKYQALLKAHTRRHTGDVFPCTFPSCTYSTPKKSTLQAHMRSHLGIRHHVCQTCQKAFIEKSHLVRHMRIHTSDKQHKCQQCDYASHRLDKLREHLQKHEREVTRNNNKEAVSAEGGNDDAASKGIGPSSEPKKRRKKKEEMPKKKQTSSKVKDSTAASSNAGIKLESTSNATAVPAVNTSPASMPQPVQGATIIASDITTSNGDNGIGSILPSSDLNVGIGRAATMSSVHEPVNIIVEAGTHYEHVSNMHSYDGSNNPDAATVVHLPAPKLEKDWNEIELLTRMGFTVTAEGHSVNLQASVPTATSHVIRTGEQASNRGEELNTGIIINNNVSAGNSGGNGLTEFTDMLRGFETLPPSSSSVAVAAPPDSRGSDQDLHHHHHHHPLHSSISVIPSDGGGRMGDGGGSNIYPGPHPPPSRTIVLASYPHQEDLESATSSQHLRATKNSDSDPHPIIMIPNMSSSMISSPPQTYLHHHQSPPQQQHHHHHHQQQHHHLHPQHHQHHPQADDDQHRYHHPRQHPSPSSSSSSSSLSQHHQQILHHQQQQGGNPSGQSSSSYSHFTGYHY